MRKNEIYELEFRGAEPFGSKINVDLKATFTIGADVTVVKGFYAGNGIYKIRFLPEKTGEYSYKTEGLFESEGNVICEDSNSLGIVRAEGVKFVQDGSLFHPFGTTVYALIHQEKELVDITMKSLSELPFNKIRMCVFPKHYEWNRNDPLLFAFEFTNGKPDVNKPVYEFWDMLESRLSELNDLGIQADLILFHPYDKWGFAAMPAEDCRLYLEYLTRRLAAFPNIWWSLANEYDLLKAYAGMFPEFAEYVAKNDPYKHLLSNHQIFSPWDFNNPYTSHVSTQTKDVNQTSRLMKKYNYKPVVYDEVRYEGNIPIEWGNLSAEEMSDRFWRACSAGAYCTHGETYITQENSQDEVLWWSKGGTIKGKSPKRIAYLKEFIYSLPGKIEPFNTGLALLPLSTYEDLIIMASQSNHPTGGFLKGLTREGFDCITHMPENSFGHINEDVYLYYLADQSAAVFYIDLPEGAEYKIETIDTWEMKRKTVSEHANGKKVKINLPGKPFMAILATKNDV